MKKLDEIPFNDLLLKAFDRVSYEMPCHLDFVNIIATRLNIENKRGFKLGAIMDCMDKLGTPSGIMRVALLENMRRSSWVGDTDKNLKCQRVATRLRHSLIFGIVEYIIEDEDFYGKVFPYGLEYEITWMVGKSYLRACVDRVRAI